MSTSTERIGLRIKEKEKANWEGFIEDSRGRFQNLTQLIKFAVNSYISGDLVERGFTDHPKERVELEATNEKYQEELHSLNEKLEAMKNHFMNLEVPQNKGIISEKLKGRILTTLKKADYTSEELSSIIGEEEETLIPELKALMKAGLITFNQDMEYYLKNKGDVSVR